MDIIFSHEKKQEQACYIRFFNGALGLDTADIFVNGELVAQDVRHGTFTPFRLALPGAFNMEVRTGGETSEVAYSELIVLMEEMVYTVAIVGDAQHLSFAVLPQDLSQDVRLPNLRFANVMPHDSVIDIEINGHMAVAGLMFRELSENIEIEPRNHFIKVYDAKNQPILEDGFTIEAGKKYLAIIAGDMGEPQNPPTLYMEEDMPVL